MFVFSSPVHIQGLQSWITSDLPTPSAPRLEICMELFSAQSPRGQLLRAVAVFHSDAGSVFPVERLVMSIASHESPLRAGKPCGYLVVG